MRKLFGTSVLAIAAAVISSGMFIGCDKKEPTPSGGNGGNGGPKTVAVTGVSLSKTSLSLVEGRSETLTATVSPDNATNKSVSWKSSATDIATVDGSGKVTAVKPGSATITVSTTDGGKTATCSVTVTEQAKIVITGNTAKVPVAGGAAEFTIQFNTSYSVEIEESAKDWLHFVETRAMQSGTLVFSVDANKGEARTGKATVKDNEGKVGAITLTFEQDPYIAVTSVQVAPETAELEEGETLELTAAVLPDDATDPAVTWESDKPDVASVENGVVTAVKEGTAVITATAGDKTASCSVTVTEPASKIARRILMEIYNSMDGPFWKNADGWGTDADLNTWAGVGFDNEKGVYSLRFVDFGLKGEIPAAIGELSDLQEFFVSNEPGVTGTLPDSFRKLIKLRSLNIQNTSMTSLPDLFDGMTELDYVFVFYNKQMTGPLPESLGNSEKLQFILIQDNAFTGTIPASWARLLDGQGTNLLRNHLSGALPETILQVKGEQLAWRLACILQQEEGFGFDISEIDIPGYWPKGTITGFDGKTFTFADVVSQNEYTVYLNWATWCPYSVSLMPSLKEYYEKYRQDGLEVIATVWHPEGHDFSDSEKALEEQTINEKGYNQWYNFFYGPYYGTMFISHSTPTAEVYDKNGNVLFSSVYYLPDPVRKRFGSYEGEKSAFDDLIPFLETLLGPADAPVYESTDFSKDGEVLTLQKASVGKGINIVFLGDGYSDKDMASGGVYETLMNEAMESFFAIEPYKTFRDRFNVYAVKAISKHDRIGEGYTTAFGTAFGNGTEVTGDLDKCYEYALKVPGITDTKNLLIPVMVNTRRNAGTAHMSESLQSSVAFFSSFGNHQDAFTAILQHEAGGHGFAFLADEYSSYETAAPADVIAEYNRLYNTYGWYSNVDFTDDPTKIRWSAFLSDDRYKGKVGIYEGAALYKTGAYRPTEDSMMNEDAPYYNAPSRWAIYKRIMELSGETASFEKFLEYDAVNRAKKASSKSLRTRSANKPHPGAPPIVVR